jgi:type II secretory pathway pseudopilin PulG
MTVPWGDYASSLGWLGPLLVGIGSIASAAVGWAAGKRSRRAEELLESKAQTSEADQRTAQARQDSAAEIEATTKRFEALIDGYENRIADLTHEVDLLRAEVIRLREVIDTYFQHPVTGIGA